MWDILFSQHLRETPVWACNLETALAKKLGHVVTRGELSKAKHLYDIHAVGRAEGARLDAALLGEALMAEVEHDGTPDRLPGVLDAIEGLRRSDDAASRWKRFERQAYYAGDAGWQDVLDSVEALMQAAISGAPAIARARSLPRRSPAL